MSWDTRDYNRDTHDHDYYTAQTGWRGWSVTIWLLVINIAVFFIDGFSARAMGRQVWDGGFLNDIGHFSADKALYNVQLWRFFSFQFLHGGVWHLATNMLMLWYLGRRVESYLGTGRYLAFYLVCGIAGAGMYLLLWLAGVLTNNPNIPFLLINSAETRLVGASAGIFGVLVACAYLFPEERVQLWFPPITLTMRVLALIVLGFALFALMVGAPNAGGDAGHVGGAIVGFILIRNIHWLNRFDRSPGDWWRSLQKRRRDAARQRETNKIAALDAEVDRILAKVKERGLQSLTDREKKTLATATDRQRKAG